ncbi:MAG: hypothetical protein U0795_22340 [Pirellulales bacterium]
MVHTYWLGLDDTDMPGTPGTNQLAKALAAALRPLMTCRQIVRHQLLDDPRVPYTSKNGSASLMLVSDTPVDLDELFEYVAVFVQRRAEPGSDPGICLAVDVPPAVEEFGRQCQLQLSDQETARQVAAAAGMRLRGLGGTEGGVIGALAAVGLACGGNDGRIVYWRDADSGTGWMDVSQLKHLGVDVVRLQEGTTIHQGIVNVGKHLRPNVRAHRAVLFVEPSAEADSHWEAVRLL